jgi:hypothetical protein
MLLEREVWALASGDFHEKSSEVGKDERIKRKPPALLSPTCREKKLSEAEQIPF